MRVKMASERAEIARRPPARSRRRWASRQMSATLAHERRRLPPMFRPVIISMRRVAARRRRCGMKPSTWRSTTGWRAADGSRCGRSTNRGCIVANRSAASAQRRALAVEGAAPPRCAAAPGCGGKHVQHLIVE